MLKRCLCILMALAMMLAGAAFATELELTDAPGTPTQDVVLSLESVWLDEERTPYDVQVMDVDSLTMDTVTEIYEFVAAGNRPARYFPEDVQQAIAEMYEVDVDALYMTEFMRLHAAEAEPAADVEMTMLLDVDYQPEQLVAVVLGDTSDPEALVWTVVEARATALGEITVEIPQAVIEQMQGEDVLFSLLTVRMGQRGGVVSAQETTEERVELPSKTAYDMVSVGAMTDANGNPMAEDFRIIVTEESSVVSAELAKIREHVNGLEDGAVASELERIREHVDELGLPIVTYFPEEAQNEVQLLLGEETDIESLVAYEYVPLITENYQETYGDAIAPFTFATPYAPGQKVVTLLGLPREGAVDTDPTLMDWAVQRAEVNENGEVEIVFDQLALIGMGEQTALMLVLSEPMPEAAE